MNAPAATASASAPVQDYYRVATQYNYQTYPTTGQNWSNNPETDPKPNCNQDGNTETCSSIHQETNTRMYQRNLPSQYLQPYLDARPVCTKYSLLPIVDPRVTPTVPYIEQPTYHVGNVFNPGNRMAPWSGYSSHVNIESELRNQIYALQRCDQAVYVPSSTSDLYDKKIISQTNQTQPFPGLFQTERFNDFNPNPEKVGQHVFLNNTRMEYQDKPVSYCQ